MYAGFVCSHLMTNFFSIPICGQSTHFALAFEVPGGWHKEKDAMTLTVLQVFYLNLHCEKLEWSIFCFYTELAVVL